MKPIEKRVANRILENQQTILRILVWNFQLAHNFNIEVQQALEQTSIIKNQIQDDKSE